MTSEQKFYQDESFYLENPAEKEINKEIEEVYNKYKQLSFENQILLKRLIRLTKY